ncbi:MAG: Hpt domain-containing protein [Proteobacteria bacterium]|nr:Hpt domain-containing protein [Pseudomonadota bacterium]
MSAATRPVDLAHLARYTGGDAALNAEVLRLFDSQVNEMVARLKIILAARDQKSWKEVTHTLKGAARGIGAFAFADAAAAAEPIDLVANGNEGAAAVTAIEARAGAVQSFIRGYLKS